MTKRISLLIAISFALGAIGASAAPFGGEDDTAYADQLWRALVRANLAGGNSLMSTPYTGSHPHGAILDTIDGKLAVQGQTDVVIVKRNYGGEGVSKQNVANNPSAYLKAITVMYKRAGYDADNQDWFWAKFKPDGSLHTNPKGMKLAGRIAKGMPKGCIACHTLAPGGDMVFNTDR
jgi:hypothetical protein